MTQPERPNAGTDLFGAAGGSPYSSGGRRRAKRRRRRVPGCLAVLVALAVVVAGVWYGGSRAYDYLKDHLSSAADYPGPGHGRVLFEVKSGDSATAIGNNLEKAGVVESADAFIDAAKEDSSSSSIQVGYYQLKKEMKASAALAILVNPKKLVSTKVTVTEGARVRDIVTLIAKRTDLKRHALVKALEDTDALGLPASADGNPEGYLFPATYDVVPGETAAELLHQMVAKTVEELDELDVAAGAKKLGLTQEQVLTVASILEYEAKRDQDYPKVARVIYNRLDAGMRLQSDATVAYANGIKGQVWTTAEERNNSSPYNTYQHDGLPPGPIGSPGETTIKAALHPATGDWLYWVVVNLRTGKTVFSTTYAEHEKAVAQFQRYCETSDAC
ncbi:MAG: endolytic transglycosylase MltG [Nocardioides sp.]|uniref:endolytic transglycosylase MltG n=1 Tax=Nocardioides sp. TaxID=35761 RepID=UPI0039E40CCD